MNKKLIVFALFLLVGMSMVAPGVSAQSSEQSTALLGIFDYLDDMFHRIQGWYESQFTCMGVNINCKAQYGMQG